ncbi:PREDICTED: histone-lysine N-methyltransferase pr-set7 isoform X2 [Nicrophorus vespilloides]|uniref:[histone H4]-lysine(20) N-methyltransferase n=1 Tax=Nicrophorus vespilloides TaxID=110193 RepID=A0ABM1M3U9_NICVS|nr:PREDICTED: histone-lysine N-methyltransferase pr-set7 isoform X2 [Nicrophorus vespilloides]
MVRGRRVRAVIACSDGSDCCSPLPKRKVKLQSKFAHSVLSPVNKKNQIISQFFQAVEVDIDDAVCDLEVSSFDNRNNICIVDSDIPSDGINDLDDKEKEEFKEILATPLGKNGPADLDILSPATPHRIELKDEQEDKVKNEAKIVQEKIEKKIIIAPRARRRLNANNAVNQQPPAAKPTIKGNNNETSHKLTEYFPVRRSVRKTNKIALEEKQRTLEQNLRKGIEQGLRIRNFEGKGRGVVANKMFQRGDFVVEYSGDLIDTAEAKRREVKYAQDQNTGCYMYYFKHKSQQYCIDATAETGRLGRLVNHSRNGNLVTRTIDVDGLPRLVLVAKDTIEIGNEVTYDYGDRSKESLRYHPWLAY